MPKHGESFPPPPFAGFKPQALGFFRELANNQDRAWFAAHKAAYEEYVLAPMQSFVSAVSGRLAEADLPLRGDHRALFRLHRDVRFSKDKRPFKTHAGAVITRDGSKRSPGLLYFHLAPAESFAAAGFYRPEPNVLQRLRQGIVADPDGWTETGRRLARNGLSLEAGESLIRLPKGFESTPADFAEVMKLKSWIVRKEIPEPELGRASLVEKVVAFAVAALPLLSFGWTALGDHPSR